MPHLWDNSVNQGECSRFLSSAHNFGIECSKSVKDSLALEKQNNNYICQDVIAKEIKNVQMTFEVFKGCTSLSNRY